jgi:hypothetical protein
MKGIGFCMTWNAGVYLIRDSEQEPHSGRWRGARGTAHDVRAWLQVKREAPSEI